MQVGVRCVELLPMMEDVGATARALLGSRPVAVAVYADPGVEALETDEHKLRQVLTSLVSNAVKLTERGRIVIGAEPEGAGVRLWVEDTGMGIREEDLDRLFAPLGRPEDALAEEHGGAGLGLATVRSLVVLLGGLVTVESQHGEGSTFSVHLPARRGERT